MVAANLNASINSKIRICKINASYKNEVYNLLYGFTNDEEKAYLNRYQRTSDRYNSLVGLTLAKQLSNQRVSESLTLLHNKKGQPYLINCEEYISISHCTNTVVAAISPCRVGIDIECPLSNVREDLFLSKDEYKKLRGSKNRARLLTTLWTLKEAYLKLEGTGFLVDPTTISFYKVNNNWLLRGSNGYFFTKNMEDGMILSLAAEKAFPIQLQEISEADLVSGFTFVPCNL